MTAPPVTLLPHTQDDGPDLAGLLTFLQDEESRSFDTELSDQRANALDFYNGEPFGNEIEGRSQVVTRDVAEVVDYATASLERPFLSSDNVVEFTTPDKTLSGIITAAVSQEFFQGQDGVRVLHDWIKAGLLEKTGMVKVCVEAQPPKRIEQTVSAEEMALLVESGAQMVAASPVDETETMWHVAVLQPQPPAFRDYFAPNEEVLIAQDARDLDSDCVYSAFRLPRTISQIAEMGYDTDGLESDQPIDGSDLSMARSGTVNSWEDLDYRTGANRKVWLLEEYARYDINGDGIAELLKIHRVGTKILDVEEIDEQPGVVFCPFPMPGRIVGQSLADKVMDIQLTRSMLFRQGFDNLHQSNTPRWTISESDVGDTTYDDLLAAPIAGGVIRHVGQTGPVPIKLPDISSSAFQMMEVLAGEKESRTGITRLNQGLDADALNKTASGTAMMQAAGQLIEDYMARNLAEAFARLLLKKYRLMRAFGGPMSVFVDGQVEQTDPRQWPEDMHVRVRVGLGTGKKDQRLAMRQMLLQITQGVESSGELHLFSPENIYNQIVGVIEDAGLGNPSALITNPAELPPSEEKPDPAMLEAQAKAMLEAKKLEQDQQKSQADIMLKARQQEADAALKAQQNKYDLQAKREKAALDEQLARDRASFEADLADRQFQFESAMALRQQEFNEELARRNAASSDGETLPKKRPGGRLDV